MTTTQREDWSARNESLLAEAFLRRIGRKTGKVIPAVSPEAMALLTGYPWPGNIRELTSAFEYGSVTCQEGRLERYPFPPNIVGHQTIAVRNREPVLGREETQRRQMISALQQSGGKKRTAAARMLGGTRMTVWKRMKRYNIQMTP